MESEEKINAAEGDEEILAGHEDRFVLGKQGYVRPNVRERRNYYWYACVGHDQKDAERRNAPRKAS